MSKGGYSILKKIGTFEKRLEWLMLRAKVGEETFGSLRWVNQKFYSSQEWKAAKKIVILRDSGYDLGVQGYPICGPVYVHHIFPISYEDLKNHSSLLFDPDNLICCSYQTHNAIHYGKVAYTKEPIIRQPFDTCPWKGDQP